MAQGGKLNKLNLNKRKSGGAVKKKAQVAKQAKKGWKSCTAKKSNKVAHAMEQKNVSKSINAKNEAIVASKALGNKNTIFLGDLKNAGKNELQRLNKEKQKEVDRHTKKSYVERAKAQLKKLSGGV